MIIAGDPIRVAPPVALPISLVEFKSHVRVSSTDEDAIMAGYIRSATEQSENYAGLGFISQTFAQTFSSFPTRAEPLVLGLRPLQSVLQITYLDTAGASQILDASAYRVAGVGWDKTPASIWPTTTLPGTSTALDAVTVHYLVGFGESYNEVPELIRLAVMQAAATFYSFREDIGEAKELPSNSKTFLSFWRMEPVV